MHSPNGRGAARLPVDLPSLGDGLSAKQRDEQRQRMISQINATTIQVNFLTERIDSTRKALADFQELYVQDLQAQKRRYATLWRRLRWLVTGR